MPATSTCVECGTTFTYRRRGSHQVTCSEECRTIRRRRLGSERVIRWALKRTRAVADAR